MGEIDILEGINQMTTNQMSLHTAAGCTQASGVTQTGTTTQTDCNLSVNSNNGCTVIDESTDSYGAGFESAGGGVWVTELADSGIK